MHILLVQMELYISSSHSLKDKRHIIKPLLNQLRRDYNVSAAEVDSHDQWQIAVLAFVMVGNLKDALERTEREIAGVIEMHPEAQLSAWNLQWI
ncbi:DUF503 domain-containing protein [soil metagenome]